jgi:hypothetical protein
MAYCGMPDMPAWWTSGVGLARVGTYIRKATRTPRTHILHAIPLQLSTTPPCPLAPNQRAQARIARRRRDTLPDHWGCEKVSVQGCGAGVAFEAANGPLVAGSMLHTFHGYSVDGNAGFNREMGQKAGTEVVKSETGSLRIGRA